MLLLPCDLLNVENGYYFHHVVKNIYVAEIVIAAVIYVCKVPLSNFNGNSAI